MAHTVLGYIEYEGRYKRSVFAILYILIFTFPLASRFGWVELINWVLLVFVLSHLLCVVALLAKLVRLPYIEESFVQGALAVDSSLCALPTPFFRLALFTHTHFWTNRLEDKLKYVEAVQILLSKIECLEKYCGSYSPLVILLRAKLLRLLQLQNKEIKPVIQSILSGLTSKMTDSDILASLLADCRSLVNHGHLVEAHSLQSQVEAVVESNPSILDDKSPYLLIHLGLLKKTYENVGLFDKATEIGKRSLKWTEKKHGSVSYATCALKSDLGFTLLKQGDIAGANKHLSEAYDMLPNLPDMNKSLQAHVLNRVGELRRIQGNLDQAEDILLNSLENSGRSSSREESLLFLARLHADKLDIVGSSAKYREVIKILESKIRKSDGNTRLFSPIKLSDVLSEYLIFLDKDNGNPEAIQIENLRQFYESLIEIAV